MLRTRMKTRLINRCQAENTEPESPTEIDNEVHPLHWATSPGPSPMGTDPINSFKKWYKWFWTLQISSAVWVKVSKTSSLEEYKLTFEAKRIQIEQRRQINS